MYTVGICVLDMVTNDNPFAECGSDVAQIIMKGDRVRSLLSLISCLSLSRWVCIALFISCFAQGEKPQSLQEVKDRALKAFIEMCLQPVESRPSAAQLLANKVFDLSNGYVPPSF
jgi:hypothetical protein